MKPLDDAIGLRALGLGAAMVDVLDGKIELIFVMLWIAAIFRAPIGKNTLQHDAVLLVEGQDPVVQEIGGHDRRLAIIELGEANLRIGIDEGLLIDAADAFQGAHIEGVLRAAIAGTFGFELALHFFLGFGLLERRELALSKDEAFLRQSRAFNRCFIVVRSCRLQMERTPKGETVMPRLKSSLETRT